MAKTKTSRLTEIYKAEKSRGGGLASAIGKATLEKVDPRQFFNQKGLLAAMLPSLFRAYKAPTTTAGTKSTMPTSLQFSTASLENKIDALTAETMEMKTHAKISAKNSMSLPMMARDMNLMRQNIAKLVKLQNVKPTYKADMFFQRSSEREAAYESQFKRTFKSSVISQQTPTSPTTTPTKTSTGSGILSSLLGIGASIGGAIAGAIQPLINGISSLLKPLLDLAKSGISLVLSAGGKIISSVAGSMASILRGALPFLLNPAVLGVLGVAGIAALIAYLIKNGVMKEGDEETIAGQEQDKQTPDTITMTPEEMNKLPQVKEGVGLGTMQDQQEQAKRIGPEGQRLVEQKGVPGYMKKGTGRGANTQFVPLQGEELINYYEKKIKVVEDLTGGETLTSTQLASQSFAKTEAGKIAIERYMKQKGSPTPAPKQTSTAPTAAEFQKTDKDTTTITSPKPGEYGQEQRFPPQTEPSESLIQFIKKKEGFSAKAYWDYQQYSNGYGTKANSPNEVIDEKEADARARKHISEVYKGVLDYTEKKGYKFNQNQIEALTSFSYNFGLGRLNQLTDNGKRDAEEISKKMVEYVNVRKKNKETGVEQLVPEPGLITRRTEEQALFNTPVNVASLNTPQTKSMIPMAEAPAIPQNIQTVIKSEGSKLDSATIQVAQAQKQVAAAPPVIIDNSSKPTVVSNPTNNMQRPAIPYDEELIKMFLNVGTILA